MHDPDVVILLFASGKLVCTGAVNEKMVYDAAGKLMAELIQKGLLVLIVWMFFRVILFCPNFFQVVDESK
ncbi:MAG: hypothetical protein QW385_08370 [Thermoproteota archaeon]